MVGLPPGTAPWRSQGPAGEWQSQAGIRPASTRYAAAEPARVPPRESARLAASRPEAPASGRLRAEDAVGPGQAGLGGARVCGRLLRSAGGPGTAQAWAATCPPHTRPHTQSYRIQLGAAEPEVPQRAPNRRTSGHGWAGYAAAGVVKVVHGIIASCFASECIDGSSLGHRIRVTPCCGSDPWWRRAVTRTPPGSYQESFARRAAAAQLRRNQGAAHRTAAGGCWPPAVANRDGLPALAARHCADTLATRGVRRRPPCPRGAAPQTTSGGSIVRVD